MSYEMVKLGRLCTVVRGSSPRPAGDPRYYGGQNPRLMVQDITRDGMYVTPKIDFLTDEGSKKSRKMEKGSLVIAVSGQPGVPAILDTTAYIHDGFAGLRDLDISKCYIPYLYHFLKQNVNKSKSGAVGAIFKNLKTDQIRDFIIPLPPLNTQKKIVEILDTAQRLIDARKEQISQMDALVQSLFYDMFGNLSAGNLPEGGIQCPLGEQITLQRGKDITKKQAVDGEVPVISSGGISFYHNVPLIDGPGVLLGRKGSVGKVHYSEVNFWPHDTTLYIKDFKGNCPLFVYHFFKQFPISQYEASAANPSLNRNNLHPVIVGWPPIDLQNTFANRVQKIEAKKAAMTASLSELEDNFNSLMQRAFKGELL